MSAGKQIRHVSGCFSSTRKKKMWRINSFSLLSLVVVFFSLNLPWLHLCIIVFLLFFLRAALRGNGCISLILRWRFCGAATSSRAGEGFSFLSCHFVNDTVCLFFCFSFVLEHTVRQVAGDFQFHRSSRTLRPAGHTYRHLFLALTLYVHRDTVCEARALATRHANANISVPLVM